jgi:ankyrin repeat protein
VALFILIFSLILLAVIALIIVRLREKVPLIKAIKRNQTQQALALIRQGADVNVRNDVHETPLMHAAIRGNVQIARLLVESGADVNAQALLQRSALMEAAVKGHADIVRLLIKAGADVKAKDWDENTALMQAAISGCKEAVDDLLAAGADINARKKDGSMALTSAILLKNTDVARTLIKAGAEVNRIDDQGHGSALHWFINTQQYKTAEAFYDDLVLAGLDINAKARGDVTVLTAAVVAAIRETAKGNHPLLNIARKLVRAGADVDTALGIAYMHKADAQAADPMGFFDRHITDVINILTSK